VVNTPRFENNWARRLGTGWTLSTIYTVRTGVPFDAELGTDNALNGFNPSGNNYGSAAAESGAAERLRE